MSAIKFTIGFAIGKALQGLKALGSELKKVGGAVKGTTDGMQGMAQRSKIDLMAWGMAFQELNNVASGMFQSIIDNSPSMGLAMANLTFETDLLAMSIGEALAPVLQPLIDLLVQLIQGFTALPEPVQAFIGLVIALTIAGTALAMVIITITTVGLPLIATIMAIVIAVAALIIITKFLWDNWDNLGNIIRDFIKQNKALAVVLIILLWPILGIIGAIIGVIAVIKNWGAITDWFSNVWGKFTEWLSSTWSNVTEGIGNAWETVVEKIMKFWNIIVSAFGSAKDLFGNVTQGIGDFLSGVITGFLNVLINGINWFFEKLNTMFDKLKGWDLLPDSIKSKIPTISLIPTFEKGGIMPFTGLAQLHAGERVLNTRETDALQTLQLNGFGRGGQSGGMAGQPISIQNDITIEGGIFTDSDSIDQLADLLSERILEKVLRGISV